MTKTKQTKYQVIYTDYGETCDYKARVLGIYKTFKGAYKAMIKDVEGYQENYQEAWEDSNKRLPVTHEDHDSIMLGDDHYGCQWQILEIIA